MTLETALKQLSTPNRHITIQFKLPDGDYTVNYANLKQVLAQRALIYKYDFVSSVGNHFVAK